MKALAPTLKNKILFTILFNIFMAVIYLVVIKTGLTLKSVAGTNLIIIIFILNWLPKSPHEMDEREKLSTIKASDFLNTISGICIVSVFVIHLIWFQEMTIIQFMLFSGGPIIIATSIFSCKLKKDLAFD